MIQMLTPFEDQPAVNDWNLQRSFDLKKDKSDICYVHPYLGRWSNLTIIFFRLKPPTNLHIFGGLVPGIPWSHQLRTWDCVDLTISLSHISPKNFGCKVTRSWFGCRYKCLCELTNMIHHWSHQSVLFLQPYWSYALFGWWFFVQTVLGIQCPMISNLQLGPFDTRNPTEFWGTDMAAMAFLTSHGSTWQKRRRESSNKQHQPVASR